MNTFNFAIIASGLDPEEPGFEDRFFEAGCDDATISFQKGVIILEFHREARNFSHALVSAVADVRRAGARVMRVEPDHLVSLSEIAERGGLSRSAVTLYAQGERGRGFPPPVARVTSESPLWDWLSVARWLFRWERRIDAERVVEARLVDETNLVLRDAGEIGDTIYGQVIRAQIRKRVEVAGVRC